MEPEIAEMGKTRSEWAQTYENISKAMEKQANELKNLNHKILMMRYETSMVGLEYLKASKQLQLIKEMAEIMEAQQPEIPNSP